MNGCSVVVVTVSDILRGLKVCILRAGPLRFDKRTQLIARSLVQHGADVLVVGLRFGQDPPFVSSDYSVVEVTPNPPSQHRVRIVRVLTNLAREAWIMRRMAREARLFGADVVHCMNVQTLWSGARAGHALRIYDSREHFATTGHVKPHVRRWWMWLERRYVPTTAAVLTVSEPIAQDLAERYGVQTPVVVYNGSVERVEEPQSAHAPLRLVHLGKAYADRNVEEIVSAMSGLADRATLAVQAWGEREQPVLQAVSGLGAAAESIELLETVLPEEIVDRIAIFDVGIINVRPETENLRWSAGNKVFEYMAAGLAMLVPDGLPETDRIVKDADCGVVFEPGDIGSAIRRLAENPAEVERYKANAVRAAAQYSWAEQEKKLVALYERVAQGVRKERR